MSKLPSVPSNNIIKRLLKAGFDYAPIKGKGGHIALIRIGGHGEKYLVIIPKRDPVPKGTLMSIINPSFEKVINIWLGRSASIHNLNVSVWLQHGATITVLMIVEHKVRSIPIAFMASHE